MVRITPQQPWETAFQLVAERMSEALRSIGEDHVLAVIFVALPTDRAVADRTVAALVANRGMAQEYLDTGYAERAGIEMDVNTDELD